MRKIVISSIMLVSLILVLGLAGCTNNESSSGGDSNEEGKTSITFWHAMKGQNGDSLNEIIDDFNEQSDSVHVEANFQGDYDESLSKLRSVAGSDEAPALVQVYDIGTKYMNDSGFITPVQDFIDDDEDDFDLSNIQEQILSYYTVDDKLLSMPFNSSNAVMYYNKDLFEKAGLDPDNPPSTYEELEDTAKTIQDKTGEYGFTMSVYGWIFEELLANQNAEFVNNDNGRSDDATEALVNSEAGVNIFELLQNMHDDGTYKNYGRDTDAPRGPFYSGQAGMYMESIGILKEAVDSSDFDVGVAPFPVPEDVDKQGLSIGGASLWITDEVSEEEQEAAWEFVKYVSSTEVQAKWAADTGYFPINEKSYDESILKEEFDKYPQYNIAKKQLDETEVSPATQGAYITEMPESRDIMEDAMESLLKGENPQDALDKAAGQIDEKLGDE